MSKLTPDLKASADKLKELSQDFKLSASKLRELTQSIISNPDIINDLDDDEVLELRKSLNPMGGIINTKKVYANMGLINWRDKYLRRLHMTALIGYLYRALEESTSDNKQSVKEFLDRQFNYNPDIHLRGSHTENVADPERMIMKDFVHAKQCSKTVENLELSEKDLKESYTSLYQISKELKMISLALSNIGGDSQSVLMKKIDQLNEINERLTRQAKDNSWDDIKFSIINPPAETFYNFDRYINDHYEDLKEVVNQVYNEKHDLEYGVILYDTFKTEEEAKNYRHQHEAEFKTEVFTIENNAVTLLGPFKENRERLDFYNKNTEIMKGMMEQLEADHKLGKDLMEKQVKQQKKKNIEECGPDAPGLSEYSKTMNKVREMGASSGLTPEQKKEMEELSNKAKAIRESLETPDESIQVDVFHTENGSMNKTHFYTQSEAPLHLEPNSKYADTYQPKE